MTNTIDLAALLKPLFDEYGMAMKPASETSLNVFRRRAVERQVPDDVVAQLACFYSIVDGVPCLDSLDIHRCEDWILFDWWDQQEIWLGQRDFYVLRWSRSKDRFCVGDVGNVSLSTSNEYRTFAEGLRYMVNRCDRPDVAINN